LVNHLSDRSTHTEGIGPTQSNMLMTDAWIDGVGVFSANPITLAYDSVGGIRPVLKRDSPRPIRNFQVRCLQPAVPLVRRIIKPPRRLSQQSAFDG